VQILECNAELFFHLQQQQMIELIRDGKIVEALLFAQEYLAYKGEEGPSILDELGVWHPATFQICQSLCAIVCTRLHIKCHAENTIALIAFEDPMKCPVKHLMESQQRQSIASEMNKAILRHLNHRTEPKLAHLVKMLAWCQDKLEGKNVKFNRLQDLQLSHASTDWIILFYHPLLRYGCISSVPESSP
jgi:glucose-induced degradation protein 8